MGHSWGSVIGLKVAAHRPELLYAYIGVGQVVNGFRNEKVGYEQTLARAEQIGNQQAVTELKALAPYPDPNAPVPLAKVIGERKWDVALGGMLYGKDRDDADVLRASSPDYTDEDVAAAQEGELLSVQALLPAVAAVDFDRVTDFRCPIFIFAGAEDRTTPESVAEEYFGRIKAPQKKFFKIERAAHYVVSEAPGEVLVDLVRDVLPLSQDTSAR
jgi:pimeloyl-ACP methyl ester carboxylesterase